jgi:glucosylceramidase
MHHLEWIASREGALWQPRVAEAGASPADLALDGTRHQLVTGLGGCFNERGWEALLRVDAGPRAAALEQLFGDDGCGFTCCRVPIGANDYALDWYSHNEHDGDLEMAHFSIARDRRYLIPYIHAALERRPELTLFASPWSPPTWMKTFKAYNHGRLRDEPAVLEAYALYFQKFVEAYAAEGIRVAQVHVQNEPYSNQKFPSCLMPAAQMRDFIRDYLGPQFERAGMACEIWAGTLEKGIQHGWAMDESQSYAQLAHLLLADPAARRYIKGMGFQWDGKGLVQRVHQAWPELPLSQTENECGDGDNSWAYALYVFDLMWHYFTNGVCAYTYWNMVLADGGESTWGWTQNSMLSVTDAGQVVYNPEFYVMKHLAHFVTPGAQRLGLRGPWSAFALAFANPDGRTAVLAANPYHEEQAVTLELDGRSYRCVLPSRSLNTFRR